MVELKVHTDDSWHAVLQVVESVVVVVVLTGLVDVKNAVLLIFLKTKYVEFLGKWHLVCSEVTNALISFTF